MNRGLFRIYSWVSPATSSKRFHWRSPFRRRGESNHLIILSYAYIIFSRMMTVWIYLNLSVASMSYLFICAAKMARCWPSRRCVVHVLSRRKHTPWLETGTDCERSNAMMGLEISDVILNWTRTYLCQCVWSVIPDSESTSSCQWNPKQ